jgi:glycopeptide antibiotics resistance protein
MYPNINLNLKTMKKHLFFTFILIAYCAILVKIMVFKEMPTIRIGSLILNFSGTDVGRAPNFVPFKTILPYLFGYKGLIIASVNLIGNIALLVPIGFLVPFIYSNITSKKSIIIAIIAGLSIEVMQVVLYVGIFDIDDIILNALGVMIGNWAFVTLEKWVSLKNYKAIIVAATTIIGISAAVFYIIYPKERQPVNYRNNNKNIQSESIENPHSDDPCNGTGGTGQITAVGNNSINIKRNDGIIQTIKFTNRTTIRNSVGLASKSDLKVGDIITLVIDESETASVVLICNISHSKNQLGK